MLLACALVGVDVARGGAGGGAADPLAGAPAVLAGPSVTASVTVSAGVAGSFLVAVGTSPVAGRGGVLLRYHVAVESGLDVGPVAFADRVEEILADPRGWTAGGDVRLQRVGPPTAASFTVLLATPATSERICRTGGMATDQYTSCRLGSGQVVINLDRWRGAVPDYGAPVAVYQAYAVNHEVGHQLGHGHELCPGPGRPAPVMQQQTLGLHGCVANPWPYLDGVRYAGPPA